MSTCPCRKKDVIKNNTFFSSIIFVTKIVMLSPTILTQKNCLDKKLRKVNIKMTASTKLSFVTFRLLNLMNCAQNLFLAGTSWHVLDVILLGMCGVHQKSGVMLGWSGVQCRVHTRQRRDGTRWIKSTVLGWILSFWTILWRRNVWVFLIWAPETKRITFN